MFEGDTLARISKDSNICYSKYSQFASYKKSRDQLQLGWVQATVMIIMYFIHPWADRQLQIEKHSAGPDTHSSAPPYLKL